VGSALALYPFSDMPLWRACMQGTAVRRSRFRWWEQEPIPLDRWLLLGVYTKQARWARGIVRKARVPQEGRGMSTLLQKQIELGLSLPVLSPSPYEASPFFLWSCTKGVLTRLAGEHL